MRAGKRVGSLCPDTVPLPFEPPATQTPVTIRPTVADGSKLDGQRATPPRSTVQEFEPLSVRIPAAVKLTGISRSRIYELIQSDDLETVKVGRSTLIPFRNLKALVRG